MPGCLFTINTAAVPGTRYQVYWYTRTSVLALPAVDVGSCGVPKVPATLHTYSYLVPPVSNQVQVLLVLVQNTHVLVRGTWCVREKKNRYSYEYTRLVQRHSSIAAGVRQISGLSATQDA